jgi:hypothetical protein
VIAPLQSTIAGLTWCHNGHKIIYTAGSQFCKGKVIWAELYGDGHKLYRIIVVDKILSRIKLIIGRFLNL